MNIAIVIATFNRCNLLKVLLDQIHELIVPSGVTLKTIIVNDGSTDNTLHMLRTDFPQVTIINGSGDWWWTKCMNEGFKKAIQLNQNYVLILNDDNEIEKDYFIKLIHDYNKLANGSILGSASVSITKPHKIESAGTKSFNKITLKFKPYYKGFAFLDENFFGVHPTWTLSGRGTLIPVEIFGKIGFYDEKLVQYGSDDEFCIRSKINKYPVYVSWNAIIYNHTFKTSKGSVYRKDSLITFLKSFFNPYSINSISKNIYIYKKYSYSILLPFYLLILILGTIKAYYFNYKND
jgi:GT2 family glycosyltransferase